MSRLTKEQSDGIKRGQNWECKLCHKSIKHGGHIHHKDGNPNNNKIGNLIAVCATCHRRITPGKKREKLWGW